MVSSGISSSVVIRRRVPAPLTVAAAWAAAVNAERRWVLVGEIFNLGYCHFGLDEWRKQLHDRAGIGSPGFAPGVFHHLSHLGNGVRYVFCDEMAVQQRVLVGVDCCSPELG